MHMAVHSDVMALRYVRARVIPVQQVRQSKTATLALQLFNAPPPLLPTISTDIRLTVIPHVCKRSNDPFLSFFKDTLKRVKQVFLGSIIS